jgi:hypothetical protein
MPGFDMAGGAVLAARIGFRNVRAPLHHEPLEAKPAG